LKKIKEQFICFLTITTLCFGGDISYNKDIILGRDNDPKTINDISGFKIFLNKVKWEILTIPGLRIWTKLLYPDSTISHFETTDKIVAFTIDDGFCGLDNPSGCMIDEVRLLFKKHNYNATFFTSGSHCEHAKYDDIIKLLDDGHELSNHGMYDTPYNNFSEINFEKDLTQTQNILNKYSDNIPPFYRAPHAKYSKEMDRVISKNNMIHFVCDAFAVDTSTPDPKWISNYILRKTKPGSILLIHMPEKDVREWNLKAIELTLNGLKERGYQVVTLSEMYNKYYLTNPN